MNINTGTKNYINSRPYIRLALKQNLINYSKLARQIDNELKTSNFEARVIAIRRYSEIMKKQAETLGIIELIKGSRLSVKTKIMTLIFQPTLETKDKTTLKSDLESLSISSESSLIHITSEKKGDQISKKMNYALLRKTSGLALITLTSEEHLEEVPGVMGYLLSLFGEHGINIVELVSCWTDTFIVIKEKDLVKSIELISR